MPVTWIVEPETPTAPQVEVVYPRLEVVVDGVDQPPGTSTVSCPELIVFAEVYVKVIVLPVEETTAFVGATVIVPVPSLPKTTCGGEPSAVSAPPVLERS